MDPDHETTAFRLRLADAPSALADVLRAIAAAGGTLRTLSIAHLTAPPLLPKRGPDDHQ